MAGSPIDDGELEVRSTLDWWDKFVAIPTTVLFVAGAATCSAFLKRPTGQEGVYGWVLVGQLACVVLAAAVPAYTTLRSKRREARAAAEVARQEKGVQQREIEARTNARVEVGSALDPVVRTLADLAGSLRNATASQQKAVRQALRSEVVSLVVQIAPQIMGPRGSTRSCYLDLDPGPPSRKLVLSRYRGGRLDPQSQQEFIADTEHGKYVIAKVLHNEADYYPDLDQEAPPGFDVSSVRYKTFISVPVVAGNDAYGLLTVDALHANDLAALDLDLMRVMADLVAAGMALSEPQQGGTSR